MDDGFCIIQVLFDEDGRATDYRFLEANPAFVKQTGLENAIGKTMRELAPLHEHFWFDTYGEIARTGKPQRFEHRAEALNPPAWYDVYAFRIDEPEEDKVAILFNNIYERKNRNRRSPRLSACSRRCLIIRSRSCSTSKPCETSTAKSLISSGS
ncbi:PAS domain-containing protein [Larkinella harenae]